MLVWTKEPGTTYELAYQSEILCTDECDPSIGMKWWVLSLCIISYTHFSFLLYANILTSLGQGGKPNLRRALGYSSKLEMACPATTVFNMKPANTCGFLREWDSGQEASFNLYLMNFSIICNYHIHQ